MQQFIRHLVSPALTILWVGFCLFALTAKAEEIRKTLPQAVKSSLARNQIPKEAVSISVIEIETTRPGKNTSNSSLRV